MTQAIQLIVGLGNPGAQYIETRHNAGAWFIEQLLKQHNIQLHPEKKFKGEFAKLVLNNHEYYLLLPTTFMNLSGESVAAVANFYKIPPQAILVVHDELDLPVGTIRIKQDGGHGGHNGLRSIINTLGRTDFMRLRIGIGHPGDSRFVTDYVLHPPSKTDRGLIDTVMSKAQTILPKLLTGNLQDAMHKLHTTKIDEEK